MKYKLLVGILVLFVSVIMMMPNTIASGWPPVWINQATQIRRTPDMVLPK
jgi:hypothetical protein